MAPASKTPTKPVKKTIRTLQSHLWLWLSVGLIAALVNWLLGLGSDSNGLQQSSGGLDQSIWIAIVFTAFVWTAFRLNKHKAPTPKIRDVFYDGSKAFLKQLLVIMFWILCLMPLLIGSFIVAQVTSPFFPATGVEKTVISIGALLLAVLSGYWVLRTAFAPVLLLDDTPWKSIKASWHMTKRRMRWIALYLIGWSALLLLPSLVLFLLGVLGPGRGSLLGEILHIVAGSLIFVLVLPFISVLLYQLYVYETR